MLKSQGTSYRKKVSISWTSKNPSEMTEGAVHQGFVLRVSEFAYSELDQILAKHAKKKIHFY